MMGDEIEVRLWSGHLICNSIDQPLIHKLSAMIEGGGDLAAEPQHGRL